MQKYYIRSYIYEVSIHIFTYEKIQRCKKSHIGHISIKLNMNKRCSPEELFGPRRTYEERKYRKRLKTSQEFSEYEIALAKNLVMTSEEYITGAEDLQDVMPELIVKFVSRLSEQNGGNLG